MVEEVVQHHHVALVGGDGHGVVAVVGESVNFVGGLEEQGHLGRIALSGKRDEVVGRETDFLLRQILTNRLRIVRVQLVITCGKREELCEFINIKIFFRKKMQVESPK